MSYSNAIKLLNGRLIVPHQREGVQWMLDRESEEYRIRGGMLCDEMGLGKTVQCISVMLGNPVERTLVIVPKSVAPQWIEELKRFAPMLTAAIWTRGEEMPQVDVLVSTYGSLTIRKAPVDAVTPLHEIEWGRIILDEAHEIRNPKSKVALACQNLRGPIRWVLTGTPVYNNMNDFISLCNFIGIDKYAAQGMVDAIQKTYILRRTKDQVQGSARASLPPIDFENVELEMYEQERQLYEGVYTSCREKIRKIFKRGTTNLHAMYILECLLRCRQLCCHPQIYYNGVARKDEEEVEQWEAPSKKQEVLYQMIRDQPPGEKTLIFCQWIDEMNMICTTLKEDGREVYRIDGNVSLSDRETQMHGFKRSTVGAVFVIQIKSGGQGLNLQEATRVYITSPTWNPSTELQAISRAHRTGQTQIVHVRRLIYIDQGDCPTIEHSMLALQQSKAEMAERVLGDKGSTRMVHEVKSAPGMSEIKKIFSIR